MKHTLLRLIVALIVIALYSTADAQVGIGTDTPNPKAVLELKSPNKNQGFLVPRLSTAERTAVAFTSTLTANETGLLVFDTDTNKFYYWSGTNWTVIEDSVGTDNQTISFTSPNLSISGGNTVNLSTINTDGQTLAYVAGTGALSITGGNAVTITGTVPGGAAGGDLTGTYPNPVVANNAITSAKIADATITSADITDGTITSADITDGTIATNDLANASVTALKLANTAVTPGTYGSATQVPQLIVDAQGRITGVTLMTISGTLPGGAAGGDLTGTYPNPTIANTAVSTAKIADGAVTNAKIGDVAPAKISAGGATAGQVLKWNGTNWTPQGDNGGTDAQTLAFTSPNLTISGGNSVNLSTLNTDGQILSFTSPNLTISGGNAVNLSAINTDAQALTYTPATGLLAISGGNNVTITGTAPGGAAGGNLAGTYPNPTIAATAGTNVVTAINDASTTGTINTNRLNAGVVLDSEAPAPGDITGSYAAGLQIGANAVGTTEIANASVTATKLATTGVAANTYGSAATVPQITVDAQGRITAAVNTTITGVAPGGTANGDLAGTYPNPTVDGLQNRPVTNTAPTTGQVLKWNGTAWAPGTDDNSAGGINGGGAVDQVTFWSGASTVTSAADFVWDSKSSFLGVNTVAPKGNLHVTGSQYASVTVLPPTTDNYEIKPTDFIIVARATSSAKPMNVALPLSTDNLGRIITIRTMGDNASTGARVVLLDDKDKLDNDQVAYFLIFNREATTYVYSVTVVATSIGWVTIGRERNGDTN